MVVCDVTGERKIIELCHFQFGNIFVLIKICVSLYIRKSGYLTNSKIWVCYFWSVDIRVNDI